MAEPNGRRSTAPAPSGVRLDPAVRRAQLVEAASAAFRGRDPAAVSFEQIAEAAGVSRSLVYAYFGDRAGLLAAVYLHDLEQLDQQLWDAVPTHLPDEAELRRIIRRYLRFARDRPEAWSLITAAGALDHPAIRAARRSRIERIVEPWGNTTEARLIAHAVLGLLEASADDWAHGRECSLERATEVLSSLLWAGFRGLRDAGATATG